jgi:hypothetical protein
MHLSAKDRARMLENEISAHLGSARPSYPADLLASRNTPME